MNPAMLRIVNELAAYKAGAGASTEKVLENQIKLLVDLRTYESPDSQLSADCLRFIQNSQTTLSVMQMMKPYQDKVSP